MITDQATKTLFLRTTNDQRLQFKPQWQRMRQRLVPLVFTIFHFFETYRELHVRHLASSGISLRCQPYTLNPIQCQVMALYDDTTLLEVHQVYLFVMSSFSQRLRPPSYASRLNRSTKGYLKDRPADEVYTTIIAIGGLRQAQRFWETKGYNARRAAVDTWYGFVTWSPVEAAPKSEMSLITYLGRKKSKQVAEASSSETTANHDATSCREWFCVKPTCQASRRRHSTDNPIFHSSLAAGPPMSPLSRDSLQLVIPDLPHLSNIWMLTAEALILERKIVDSRQKIKRNTQVLLALILDAGTDGIDDWASENMLDETQSIKRHPADSQKEEEIAVASEAETAYRLLSTHKVNALKPLPCSLPQPVEHGALCTKCTEIDAGTRQAVSSWVAEESKESEANYTPLWQSDQIKDLTHLSMEELEQSAVNGCPCCQMIYQTVMKRASDGGLFFHYVKEHRLKFETQLNILGNFVGTPSKATLEGNYFIYKTPLEGKHDGTYLTTTFEFFRHRDLQPPVFKEEKVIIRRELQERPDNDLGYEIVSSWIQKCVDNHLNCRQIYSSVPTRLLNISGNDPFLDGDIRTSIRYAALSHCWGIVPTLTTTLTNLEALSRKITMAQIPRTFQDAIKISKRLGFEYLWIDSLCIIQDSEEDWLKESVKMIEYYRNAYLTISVLDSPDSHHGILNSRDYIPSAKLSSEANLYLREKLREQREVLKDALLSSRAWALQERLLSTRILHYSSKEMFWECQTCSARESSTEEISGGVDPDSVTVSEGDDFKRILSYISQTTSAAQKMQVMSTWYRIVTQYSRKDLTRDSDKLPAISGIASAVKEITGYTYLAGIWGEDPKGLLWFSDGSLTPNTAYRGPSWSWASYGALPVSLHFGSERQVPSARDAEIMYDHDESICSKFGQASSGFLKLEAFTTQLYYHHSRYKHRLDDKPWSLEGFHHQRGQDIDLVMSPTHGFGKGYLDAVDEELLAAYDKLSSGPKCAYYVRGEMKRCLAIWMQTWLGEADSYIGGCMNDVKGQTNRVREILYCLLVVKDKEAPGSWRRIGVARAPMEYIKRCKWLWEREITLV